MSQSISLRLLASSALIATAAVSSAQTTKPAAKPAVPVHRTTTTIPVHPVEQACSKLPEISAKVPALPAGLPCARPLYTITTEPPVKLDYVSPVASSEQIRTTLGIESDNISLSYIDTEIGTGPLAESNKWYTIHYTGYLTDGTKFDSSVDRNDPIVINYGKHMVINGWDTGFGGMHVGGKRRLFIPYQLAYGPQGKAPIPPKAMLIFDVQLVAQSDEKPVPKPAPAPNDSASPVPPNQATPVPAVNGAKPAQTTPNPDSH